LNNPAQVFQTEGKVGRKQEEEPDTKAFIRAFNPIAS